jgi:protein disulfide-isomerase
MFRRTALCAVVTIAAFCLPGVVRAQSKGVAWRTNLDAAKVEAAQTGRLLLLHFYTQSCGPCKLLDQNVLSQPHVGAAVERNYVPVKVDADASPALANMFRIEKVPTDIVVTPQGNLVASLSAPQEPDKYVEQLENLARHVQQTTPGGAGGAPQPSVNAAYASLPQGSTMPQQYAQPTSTAPATPQQQANPYVVAAPTAGQAPVVAGAMPESPTAAISNRYGAATVPAGTTYGAATAPTPNANGAYAAVGTQIPPAGAAANPTTMAAPAGVAAPSTAVAAGDVAQVQPMQPPLPPNCPPVAFDGCCPVTLKSLNKWAMGSTAFGAIHRGRTYLFVGEAERQQFLADPDAYSPVFAGYDPVLLLDKQQTVPGSRKFGFKYGNAFYLFSCAETRDAFKASPQTYAAGVRQAMARVDAAADGMIRR